MDANLAEWPRVGETDNMTYRPDGAASFTTQADRRRARSSDPLIALTRMLDAARSTACLEALAVSDMSGLLVAGSGASQDCDELAAWAPLVAANDTAPARGEVRTSARAEVWRIRVDGVDLLLSALGSAEGRAATLHRAAAGCERILRETSA